MEATKDYTEREDYGYLSLYISVKESARVYVGYMLTMSDASQNMG